MEKGDSRSNPRRAPEAIIKSFPITWIETVRVTDNLHTGLVRRQGFDLDAEILGLLRRGQHIDFPNQHSSFCGGESFRWERDSLLRGVVGDVGEAHFAPEKSIGHIL